MQEEYVEGKYYEHYGLLSKVFPCGCHKWNGPVYGPRGFCLKHWSSGHLGGHFDLMNGGFPVPDLGSLGELV